MNKCLLLILAFLLIAPPVKAEDSAKLLSSPDLSVLSPEERDLWNKGELSQAHLLAGGFLGTFVGFGTGHIPYQMYGQRGWVFTAGELTSLLGIVVGINTRGSRCENERVGSVIITNCRTGSAALLVASAVSFFLFRLAEVIDVWTIPSLRNYQLKDIRNKLAGRTVGTSWSLHPTAYQPSPNGKLVPSLEFALRF